MKKILIVEDDHDLSNGLCLALKESDLQLIQSYNLKTARELFMKEEYELVLLDVNLPDGNGLDFLKEIKEKGRIPVILLTANDTEMDVVIGLEKGADDYITKPFSLAILRARVWTQLRREVRSGGDSDKCLVMGDYRFDFGRMEFYVKGMQTELSKTEQKLLRILVENRGVTMSRADLVDRIWTDGAEYVDENALSVTVKRLRDKLDAGDYIKTVYGLGYVWASDAGGDCAKK